MSAASLSVSIDLAFGPKKGLYVDRWKRTRQLALSYEPHYVLSAAEVTRLLGGASTSSSRTRPPDRCSKLVSGA